jgi:hypothetical protein
LAGPRGNSIPTSRPPDELTHSAALAAPQKLVATAHGPTRAAAGIDGQPAAVGWRLPSRSSAQLRWRKRLRLRCCGAIGDQAGFDRPAAGPSQPSQAPTHARTHWRAEGRTHPPTHQPKASRRPRAPTHAPTCLSALVLLLVRWVAEVLQNSLVCGRQTLIWPYKPAPGLGQYNPGSAGANQPVLEPVLPMF